MAFKITTTGSSCPDDPESLLRDLRKRTIPGLLSHQADVIRDYLKIRDKAADIALQLPTGSGKTLVGLLIGEWRRRSYGERIVYLCPTNQLVNQVSGQARAKYGIDLQSFTGSKADYDRAAMAEWQNAEAIAVTNYSSLFNVNPFFVDPHIIVLDDAHSAENYIASYWSLLIEAGKYPAVFTAIQGVILPLLAPSDRLRFASPHDDGSWVDKVPTPVLASAGEELTALLDAHTRKTDLRFAWRTLRDHLQSCHAYVSTTAVLIRPLIPPTNSHAPFAKAKQRLYMSATLGAGGDLERITGRTPIQRIAVPPGWDKQGIGRRFFLMPERAMEEVEAEAFVVKAMRAAARSLYLVPDDSSAERARTLVRAELGFPTFDARQIEESKQPFVEQANAVAVVANRYDGIDLVDDECRLLLSDGLPKGANLQERFLSRRVGAQLLLDDRILTRVVQGFGRCTRSPNDFAAVVILGDSLNQYLLRKERREFFHPEIQAELEFGLSESKEATVDGLIENLRHFLSQDRAWDQADAVIVALRSKLSQRALPATDELRAAVDLELRYQYSMWQRSFTEALECCRGVLAELKHVQLRGYRALWLYLAGSAAWLAHQAGQMKGDDIARDYFAQARKAAPGLTWLLDLERVEGGAPQAAEAADEKAAALVERIEEVIERLGTVHNRKYDDEEAAILRSILQDDDAMPFEQGHECLGRLLGYKAGRSQDDASPDCWWIVDHEMVLVFEDHADGKVETVFGATKARQAASHPEWIRLKVALSASAQVVPILITPCTKQTDGARPHLNKVRYWHLPEFRAWAKEALCVVRDLRRTYPGAGDLFWRAEAADRIRAAKISPMQLLDMLTASAGEAMELVGR